MKVCHALLKLALAAGCAAGSNVINPATGLCLDVQTGCEEDAGLEDCVKQHMDDLKEGTPLQLFKCHNGVTQDFEFVGGRLRNPMTGLCVAVNPPCADSASESKNCTRVKASEIEKGARLMLLNCQSDTEIESPNSHTDQKWDFLENGLLKNEASGLCMDAYAHLLDDGTRQDAKKLESTAPVQIYRCHAKGNQIWDFETGDVAEVSANEVTNGKQAAPIPEDCDRSKCDGCSGTVCLTCRQDEEVKCCLDAKCRGCGGEQCTACRDDHREECCVGMLPLVPSCPFESSDGNSSTQDASIGTGVTVTGSITTTSTQTYTGSTTSGDAGDLEFDCSEGANNWKKGWSPVKQRYCCKKVDLGCKFDCAAGDNNIEAGWSEKKKEWCCENRNKGCVVDVEAKFALRKELVSRTSSGWLSPNTMGLVICIALLAGVSLAFRAQRAASVVFTRPSMEESVLARMLEPAE